MPESLVFRVTAHNRGPERAPLHLIPQLWFRNTWAWSGEAVAAPSIRAIDDHGRRPARRRHDTPRRWPACSTTPTSAPHVLELPDGRELLFTDNETNAPRVFGWTQSRSRYVKDAFHRRIVDGEHDAVNPAQRRDEGVRLDAGRDRRGRSRTR